MGSRANYIITHQGRHELYYSHWGAQKIDRDFLFGPHVAIALTRSLEPTTELLDEIWAEGGALIDLDRRRLRLWGGEDMCFDVNMRQVWLELVRLAWQGWDVRWADHGVFDLADHLSLPRTTVRDKEPFLQPFEERYLEVPDGPVYFHTFVTIRHEDGRLHDSMLRPHPRYVLGLGPPLLPRLRQLPPSPIPVEGPSSYWPHQTIYLDAAHRVMSVCLRTNTFDPDAPQTVQHHWPNWEISFHLGGMPQHLRTTGRDPTPFARPLDLHLDEIRRIALLGNPDPKDMADTLLKHLKDIQQIQVNPFFFQHHHLDLSSESRQAHIDHLISMWRHSEV